MDINYELYKVFCQVAKTLSFSEASKRLFISQSAVSQSVKLLEKHLGQPLFIRSTKKVRLTPEGEILFKHIEPAINLIQRGENRLLETNPQNGGQLRIAASDTICRYFLVPRLKDFRNTYPNVHLKVTNATSIECARLLENGQVDCIVTNYPNSGLTNAASIRVIHEFRDVFVANAAFFPLKDRTLTLAELAGCPILMLNRKSATSEFLHALFQKSHLDLVPEIELSSNDFLIDLARIGFGIAFVPDFCLPQKEADLFVLKLKETLPPRRLIAACSETVPLSGTARQFMDILTASSGIPSRNPSGTP
ncbi:MAG: LysR family transcriptional regulator [Lachnospiraceae bacterium]|nr:LysR family transcriptional regulator [Lachnospiraceae bacterium]